MTRRLRQVTPFRLLVTLLVALGNGTAETIADIHRAFNFHFQTSTAYKAFYMRLARPEFALFTREVLSHLLTQFTAKVLHIEPQSPLTRFSDIVIQDGSSFALKPSLQHTFPGRFTTREPAAVEIHVTLSGLSELPTAIHLTPDTTHERASLPDPETLVGKLLLADRGYPSRKYFQALGDAGAYFVMRLSRSFKPRVYAIHGPTGTKVFSRPVPLASLLTRPLKRRLDLDIELCPGSRSRSPRTVRLVVSPGPSVGGTWHCTNLPRQDFDPDLVARLYRFRWQVELLFKEWKSYANLRKFDTSNPHIAEGLIWASLAAATLKRFLAHAAQHVSGRPISTRKVAMGARAFLGELLDVLTRPHSLRRVLRRALHFLSHNAQRAHPRRDRETGRLAVGLRPCGVR